MSTGHQEPIPPPQEFDRLERKENEVWRLAILMLMILAVGVAVLSHQALQTSPWHLEALPAGAGFPHRPVRGLHLEQEARDRRTARLCSGHPESSGVASERRTVGKARGSHFQFQARLPRPDRQSRSFDFHDFPERRDSHGQPAHRQSIRNFVLRGWWGTGSTSFLTSRDSNI